MNTLKIIFITFISTVILSVTVKSQSIYEFGIKFTNDSAATLVGADGLILYTSDGGASWTQRESNTTNVLYCTDITYNIYSTNSPQRIPIGISVGENGMILRSINGGFTWGIVSSGTIEHLRGVSSNIYTQSAVACGDNGVILFSSDAGASFSTSSSGINDNLYAVAFSTDVVASTPPETNRAICVGDNGKILMTNDNGITWTVIDAGITKNLRSISWSTVANATIVGENGAIYSSTDGGYTWNTPSNNFTTNLNSVKYLDQYTALAVGDSGLIVRTTDNGSSWNTIQSNTDYSIMSVNFGNSTRGIAVGEAGTTLISNDGGLTWGSQPRFKKDKISTTKPKKEDFSINQNYPNPFNPSTQISYKIAIDSKVSIKVFDLTGKEVAELVNQYQKAGKYSVNFNATNLSSGVYFYRILAGNFSEVKRMLLVK